jgi:hypothetical protein
MTTTILPVIVFQVNLFPLGTAHLLEDSNYTTLKTLGVPGTTGELVHGDTFTLSGLQSLEVKNGYSNGVVGDYTSFPLMIVSVD